MAASVRRRDAHRAITAQAIAHTKAKVCDTRKTTPLLRAFEKYAVRCGGGANHRFGLDDAMLIKDNHIAVAGGVGPALRAAKAFAGHLVKIEIEVDTLEQLREVLEEGVDVVLLDNMSLADLREAVAMIGGRVIVEASGGVTLETIAGIAETGVDLISVGALTHSARVLDLGLDVVVEFKSPMSGQVGLSVLRPLQTFGPGVSSAPLMQCGRLDHAAFPRTKLVTASTTGIFPAARLYCGQVMHPSSLCGLGYCCKLTTNFQKTMSATLPSGTFHIPAARLTQPRTVKY